MKPAHTTFGIAFSIMFIVGAILTTIGGAMYTIETAEIRASNGDRDLCQVLGVQHYSKHFIVHYTWDDLKQDSQDIMYDSGVNPDTFIIGLWVDCWSVNFLKETIIVVRREYHAPGTEAMLAIGVAYLIFFVTGGSFTACVLLRIREKKVRFAYEHTNVVLPLTYEHADSA